MRRLLVAACAAAAITVAGCGTTATPTLENTELSAAAVLTQSAKKADEVTSYAADIVMDITAGAQGKGNIQGTMLYQKTLSSPPTSRSTRSRSAARTCPGACG